ncbi:hypothetical protein ILYODFUR_022589 [Ilyodon furcidens]|uniref:Uncharacterized protein n=1 Tax=Ilyodon furcidens TaxID=33524 RepID=A0ABV0V7G4_9TELE
MRRTGNSLSTLPLLHCCRKRKNAQQVRVGLPAETANGSAHFCRRMEVPVCFSEMSNTTVRTQTRMHPRAWKTSLVSLFGLRLLASAGEDPFSSLKQKVTCLDRG